MDKFDRDDVKVAERDFHDNFYKNHGRGEFPPTNEEFLEYVRRMQFIPFHAGGWSYWGDLRKEVLGNLGDVRGKCLLDYGCGTGQMGLFFALQGARVWGFDLSSVGIQIAREMSQRYGVRAEFETLDAENLPYSDCFFDLVIGFGILHHVVKYANAAHHVWRILKPGGKAIFVETLWDNPLINFARRFTSLEGAGDVPLTEKLILEFSHSFSNVVLKKRHLVYMLKRLAKLPRPDLKYELQQRPFWVWLRRLDQLLLKLRPLNSYCGEVIVELTR